MNPTEAQQPIEFVALEVAERSRAPFWHQLSDIRQREALARSGWRVAGFMASYRQPKWCGYPAALVGPVMGCTSLMTVGLIHSFADCEGCDLRGETARKRGSEANLGRSAREAKP